MIAWVFAATHLTINTGGDKPLRQRRAEQQMVDAQPGIPGKGVPEILPEGVDPLARVHCPQSVRPALFYKPTVGVPHLGPKQRVINPALRRIDVELRRHDVVIAGEHDWLAACEQRLRVLRQPVKPAQLVVEFETGRGIAVRQVETSDNYAVDRRLDIPAVRVVELAGQTPADLYRLGAARQDRNAVPAFLPVPNRAVTGTLDRGFRELLIRRLEFLKADDVRCGLFQPFQQAG